MPLVISVYSVSRINPMKLYSTKYIKYAILSRLSNLLSSLFFDKNQKFMHYFPYASIVFDKSENKITANKIEQGVEKLKNTPVEELSKQLEKVNRDDLRQKINELDADKIKDMKLDVEKIKKKLTPADMEKIKKLAGNDADLVMKKINELSKK